MLLPYDENDDEAAVRYVNYAVRQPRSANWNALTSDDRVTQTYRALRRVQADVDLGHLRRYEQIRQAELDQRAGLISAAELAEKYETYTDWRSRAATFDAVLRQYLDLVTDRVRTVRRDPVLEQLRASLLTLACAVDEHRAAHSGEESLADTALWARLHTLPWPAEAGTTVCRLSDAVTAERDRRGPARAHGEGVIHFEGRGIQGTLVDVADLLLDVTDHTNPTIARPKLVELWKQRTPDLMDTEAATVMRKRQDGNYATHRLRKALLLLENLGMIARLADNTTPQIQVTDRGKLSELRRRWNEKHFTVYDLRP